MTRVLRVPVFLASLLALSTPSFAQQTGSVSGTVTASDGSALPGVTVEARSNVLPAARVTVTGSVGDYRLPALPPGIYTLQFSLSGMQPATRQVQVQLSVDTTVDASLSVAGVSEVVTVTAETSLVNRAAPTIQSALSNTQITSLPVGQEYRDLVKLIPGVQYTEDAVRGPSAGGSGQDNVYQFDGVNVTLPLFGTLSAEPAAIDIAQITTTKGGARAIDFDRSGGFTIDSVSKSGTNRYSGQLGIQFQSDAMSAGLNSGSLSRFDQNRAWMDASLGGPVVPDHLFFYASYYRPTISRENRANLYGNLPRYESNRNEGFGKLTFVPVSDVLINFSYRDSRRLDESDLFASNASVTTGTGSEAKQRIGILEGSWVASARSFVTFKYTHFGLETLGRPDRIAAATATSTIGTQLDVNNLDQVGLLTLPLPVAGSTAYNAFIQPLIDRYGYDQNGTKIGGGKVGVGSEFNDQDFFRNAGQVGFNLTLGSRVVHELHAGYQRSVDSEELLRSSNGWGSITVPGGRGSVVAGTGQSPFYTARFQRITPGVSPIIKSKYQSQSLEFNDNIRVQDFTFNVGVLISNDTLLGQGLRADASKPLTGFVSSPGTEYEMYDVPFSKMVQPRVGVTWAYDGHNTVFASYARYNPAASSLPRAASWDRNVTGTFIDAHFDAAGRLFAAVPVGSSSGKLFVEDMTPRRVDEVLFGTSRQITDRWSARVYGRHREGSHYWEDTNNNARVAFNPPAGIPQTLYIADLSQRLAEIGSGSSYVIAELDGAYTTYNEVTIESEWRTGNTFLRGSYTWSDYYGNFDQDNTTVGNDANIFIGSSNLADGAGRQLWDRKDGTLRGDRPHAFKIYGYRNLPWDALIGTFIVAQSGQPWEPWNYEIYKPAVGTSTSDTIRYAERAGSRRSDSHWQMDLKYTQSFHVWDRYRLQFIADLFNVTNNQTGYNIQPSVHDSTFGKPRSYFSPRRLQIAFRLVF